MTALFDSPTPTSSPPILEAIGQSLATWEGVRAIRAGAAQMDAHGTTHEHDRQARMVELKELVRVLWREE